MLGLLNIAKNVAGGILGRFVTDKDEIIKGQQRANESEIQGGPTSRLRLWRAFLGWVLALAFAWEVIGRGIISTYWPSVPLPPSMMDNIHTLLLGMLGLGL